MEVTTADEAFNVRWASHHRAIVNILEQIYSDETYVDCSLAADGKEISAHKLVLSACSPFLRDVLKKHRDKHSIIVLNDIEFVDLQAVVEFMYRGEVKMKQERLRSFLKAAEMLQVAGLGFNKRSNSESSIVSDGSPKRAEQEKIVENETEPDEEMCDVEYLSEEGETSKDDYKFFIIDDNGIYREISDATCDVLQAEEKADLEDLLATTLSNPEMDEPVTVAEPCPPPLPSHISRYRATKSNQYIITCSQCGGIYKNESSFRGHLRHDCNQLHKCEACLKVFKNKRHLLDHIRDDCGRVHICPNCNRSFKQKVNLTTHQKNYCKPDRR